MGEHAYTSAHKCAKSAPDTTDNDQQRPVLTPRSAAKAEIARFAKKHGVNVHYATIPAGLTGKTASVVIIDDPADTTD